MTKGLLLKYLNNGCTEEELRAVLLWINKEALTEEGNGLVLEDWNNFHEADNLPVDNKFILLFDKIQEEINKREAQNKKGKSTRLEAIAKWLTRAAAILLIPVLAFLFYTISEKHTLRKQCLEASIDSVEVIAPAGSRSVVQLADGTKVHLNYGSKMRYPQVFSAEKREIVLEGEGYFEVAHNPGKPFVVKANGVNIKALGTEFNVQAYLRNEEVKTTLVKGKVVLERIDSIDEVHTLKEMKPGQHVVYNSKTGSITSTSGNICKHIAWKNGKIVFEDTSVFEAAETLSQIFNVDIRVAEEVMDFNYTVKFSDESLFQILDLMTIATPVKYNALPRKRLPDGSYSKQIIIIENR